MQADDDAKVLSDLIQLFGSLSNEHKNLAAAALAAVRPQSKPAPVVDQAQRDAADQAGLRQAYQAEVAALPPGSTASRRFDIRLKYRSMGMVDQVEPTAVELMRARDAERQAATQQALADSGEGDSLRQQYQAELRNLAPGADWADRKRIVRRKYQSLGLTI